MVFIVNQVLSPYFQPQSIYWKFVILMFSVMATSCSPTSLAGLFLTNHLHFYSDCLELILVHVPVLFRETIHMLTCETPDFIVPTLWLANSPDLSPVDYQIWGICRRMCPTSGFMTSACWSRVWSKSGNISTRWSIDHRWSRQAVVFMSSSLHWSMWRIFTLNMFDFCNLTTACL